MKKYFITGVAGFIGSSLAKRLLKENKNIIIIGIDNMNEYYDVNLKKYRLSQLTNYKNFVYVNCNLTDKELIHNIFDKYNPNIVINLAAQAGVRDSITNPDIYIESNIIGFYNILEECRKYPVEHLVYASSSSVYGDEPVPYNESVDTNKPVSLYGATKKCDEVLAYSYSKLYNIPTTGLRFFTVYGPAGRPDMAYFKFTNKLINNEKIQIYNYGNCLRDFTYIDDVVEGTIRVMGKAPEKKQGEDGLPIAPYKIYNIGNSHPEKLNNFVKILSEELIKVGILSKNFDLDSHIELLPMQPGDVLETYADTYKLEKDFGFKPNTSLRDGLRKFSEWYKEYYINQKK